MSDSSFSILYHGCPTQTAPVLWGTWSSTSETTWAVVVERRPPVLPSSDSKLLAGKSCPMAAMELSLKKSRREVLQILWDIYYQVIHYINKWSLCWNYVIHSTSRHSVCNTNQTYFIALAVVQFHLPKELLLTLTTSVAFQRLPRWELRIWYGIPVHNNNSTFDFFLINCIFINCRRWGSGMERSLSRRQKLRRSSRCDRRLATRFPSGVASGPKPVGWQCKPKWLPTQRHRPAYGSTLWPSPAPSSIFSARFQSALFKCKPGQWPGRPRGAFSDFKWSPWGNNAYAKSSSNSEPSCSLHQNTGRFGLCSPFRLHLTTPFRPISYTYYL